MKIDEKEQRRRQAVVRKMWSEGIRDFDEMVEKSGIDKNGIQVTFNTLKNSHVFDDVTIDVDETCMKTLNIIRKIATAIAAGCNNQKSIGVHTGMTGKQVYAVVEFLKKTGDVSEEYRLTRLDDRDMRLVCIEDLLKYSGRHTVRQIEDRLEIPKSTVHRILTENPDKFVQKKEVINDREVGFWHHLEEVEIM